MEVWFFLWCEQWARRWEYKPPSSLCSPCSFGFVGVDSATSSAIRLGMKGGVWDEHCVCSAALLIFQKAKLTRERSSLLAAIAIPASPLTSLKRRKTKGDLWLQRAAPAEDSGMHIPVPSSQCSEEKWVDPGWWWGTQTVNAERMQLRKVTHLMLIQSP